MLAANATRRSSCSAGENLRAAGMRGQARPGRIRVRYVDPGDHREHDARGTRSRVRDRVRGRLELERVEVPAQLVAAWRCAAASAPGSHARTDGSRCAVASTRRPGAARRRPRGASARASSPWTPARSQDSRPQRQRTTLLPFAGCGRKYGLRRDFGTVGLLCVAKPRNLIRPSPRANRDRRNRRREATQWPPPLLSISKTA